MLCAQHAPIITEDGPISHIREVPCLHSLNGIETSVGQFFDFVKNLQFRFFETLQNLRTSVSGTFSESKEPPVTYQMSHTADRLEFRELTFGKVIKLGQIRWVSNCS